ncbi:MAG: 50S ribosomal protein L32 [Chlamydiia bacterium]|nr:50S ribosomal protein L32 [Chlamydiia bacterium]
MAVPRNRHSNARKNTRRAHHALKGNNLAKCENCGANREPHRMCGSCGQYKGRAIKVTAEQA